mmetsp:Transcript_19755/g.31365  ORF Transcript_19755/g.31365 Transcript_19755/m.31365 type:complete len:158 (+) Transcript_19755:1333-1806(+)
MPSKSRNLLYFLPTSTIRSIPHHHLLTFGSCPARSSSSWTEKSCGLNPRFRKERHLTNTATTMVTGTGKTTVEQWPVFLKYTHHLSDGWLMVSDLQGVRLSKKEFVLTDPAILCLDTSRFQPTNSGKEGMKRLLNEVKRAPDIHSIISRSTETGTAA